MASRALLAAAVAIIAALIVVTPMAPTRDAADQGCDTGVRPSATYREAPLGVPGTWTRTFTDEFDAPRLDRSVWSSTWFKGRTMNGHSVLPRNVQVVGSCLELLVDADGNGAVVNSNPRNGDISRGLEVKTDVVLEARVRAPGRGGTIYNWPAWWTGGHRWPTNGEIDIFEGLHHRATSNYHSKSHRLVSRPIAGDWGGEWHTYSVERAKGVNRIYWDGRLVRSYRTHDGGAPHYLLFTNVPGDRNGLNRPAALQIDYVRVWRASGS